MNSSFLCFDVVLFNLFVSHLLSSGAWYSWFSADDLRDIPSHLVGLLVFVCTRLRMRRMLLAAPVFEALESASYRSGAS